MAKKQFDGAIIREVQTISLSTLADQAAIAFSVLTLSEDFRILKSELTAGIRGLDDEDISQGLLLGIANGELSAAEIAACLTSGGPLDRNDRANQETAERWVKILSSLEMNYPNNTASAKTQVDGIFKGEGGSSVIVSKDRWTYSDPEGWQFFIFNNTSNSLVTGAQARLQATHYGVWVS